MSERNFPAMDGYDDWLVSQAWKDRCAAEEAPITLTPSVKKAIVAALLKYGPNLYRVAQDAAPDDVDVDEHEFQEFMEDIRWALKEII
ncbi:MAG: hypothetical protein ACYSW8_26965 [Planctomycetota bacterium]|jgi:hypothetical protein